jgi:peroxiredoxin
MARAAGGNEGRSGRAGGAVSHLIAVGATAPDFTAQASDGRTYRLSDLLAESRVMLAFYPGNDTPG